MTRQPQISTTVGPHIRRLFDELVEHYGSGTVVLSIAICDLGRKHGLEIDWETDSIVKEQKENKMSQENLFDLFVGGQASVQDIAPMDVDTIAAQVGEMRADDPDDIPMTDHEIAQAIHDYATHQ